MSGTPIYRKEPYLPDKLKTPVHPYRIAHENCLLNIRFV